MGTLGTILIAVLVFGLLILIRELGHFLFARLFGVTVEEFSIGMGPRLLSKVSPKTGIRYSLALIPFGGYVAMAGENEECDDPNSFDKKPAWQRFIITVAGASVNIIAGFLAMVIYTSVTNIGGTLVYDFPENSYTVSSEDSGLMAGDRITHVDGVSVGIADELSYEIMRRGYEPLDLTVIRDGQTIVLHDVVFPTDTQSGQTFGMMDFRVVGKSEKNIFEVLEWSVRKSFLMMRMCWESLFDLITGRYTIEAVSGPVGISGAIGDAAAAGIKPLLYMVAMISINLGIMNLLPIPALDGGRTLTLLFEMITRKRIPPKVENTVNTVGLMVLLGFSFLILIKDVLSIIF